MAADGGTKAVRLNARRLLDEILADENLKQDVAIVSW
jgi:hypothetical protein